jgi:hypothetical protein
MTRSQHVVFHLAVAGGAGGSSPRRVAVEVEIKL